MATTVRNGRASTRRIGRIAAGVVVALLAFTSPAWAAQARATETPLADLESVESELSFDVASVPLATMEKSAEVAAAWNRFRESYGEGIYVRIDPRSGRPTNVVAAIPLIPGPGTGNRVGKAALAERRGGSVIDIDPEVVADVFRRFVEVNRDTFDVDVVEFDEVRATKVTDRLWQFHASRQVGGVPVRDSRLVATISHGNLVLIGTEVWGTVDIELAPSIGGREALRVGFEYAGGMRAEDEIVRAPALEIVPRIDSKHVVDGVYAGPQGQGYDHRLIWTYRFRRPGSDAVWEVMVDAHEARVISFQNVTHYGQRHHFVGGVYAETNTGICPTGDHDLIDVSRCGEMQSGYPMPYMNYLTDTYYAADGAGGWSYVGYDGWVQLRSRLATIDDECGGTMVSSIDGEMDFGGQTGDHDCDPATGPFQYTSAAGRTAFYEIARMSDIAGGWLGQDPVGKLHVDVNVPTDVFNRCNSYYYWDTNTLSFYAEFLPFGCANTGEITSSVDHEWGHALDFHDANGMDSKTGEAYADIATAFRGQDSCISYGFFNGGDYGCGQAEDGSGPLFYEVPGHCLTECTGVRDIDWAKHADGVPDIPKSFVCDSCPSGNGPCGKDRWCSSTPVTQAAWDLVARELTAAPYHYDTNEAFLIGSRLFYQGSGNVRPWYSCDCGLGSSHGCDAGHGYMQWLAADDDNGNLWDGTPHMTAIFNAFDRHLIACSDPHLIPEPVDRGCDVGPTTAPDVSLFPGEQDITLSWTAVEGAHVYWVLRSEGVSGCESGKALIEKTDLTQYVDTEILPGHQYCYSVVGENKANGCTGGASLCTCTTAGTCPNGLGWSDVLFEDHFKKGIGDTWKVKSDGSGHDDGTWVDTNPCRIKPDRPFDSKFVAVDSRCAGAGEFQDELLISPEILLDGCKQVGLEFSNQFAWESEGAREFGDVDVSTDGGATWRNVLRIENRDDGDPDPLTRAIDLTPQVAGATALKFRFHYYDAANDGHWAIDNVRVSCGCR